MIKSAQKTYTLAAVWLKRIAFYACAIAVAGCASPELDPNYTAYLTAMNAQQAAQAVQPQKPLVDIKCQVNTPCSFASITVYAPPTASVSGDPGGRIAEPKPQINPWPHVLTSLIGVVGQAGGYAYGAKAALGIAESIKDAGVAGYSFVQAPVAAGATTVITNSGNTATASNSGNTATTTTTSSTTQSQNPVTTTTPAPTTNPLMGK